MSPAQRQDSLIKLARNINGSPEARAELEKWGLSIDEKLMDVGIIFSGLILLVNYFTPVGLQSIVMNISVHLFVSLSVCLFA